MMLPSLVLVVQWRNDTQLRGTAQAVSCSQCCIPGANFSLLQCSKKTTNQPIKKRLGNQQETCEFTISNTIMGNFSLQKET